MTDKGKFGEPWTSEMMGSEGHRIYRDKIFTNSKGLSITGHQNLSTNLPGEISDRIVACVNACDGVEEPEKEIARLRAVAEEAKTFVLDLFSSDCPTPIDELKAALDALGEK
jgi:hypothetical protein